MNQNRIILPILPRAWTQYSNDGALWYIPLDCRSKHRVTGNPEHKGLPCDLYVAGDEFCGHFKEDGKWCGHTLSKQGRRKKQQIERYNQYRMDLFHLAKKLGFQLQAAGTAIYYHFPVPIRWAKKKKEAMHGQLKMSKSDCTNLDKSLEDALTGKDEGIAHRAGQGKYWFRPELVEKKLQQGYIEIITGLPVYNPYNVTLESPYQTIEMEDINSRREKAKARKAELKEQKQIEVPKKKVQPIRLKSDKKLFSKEDRIR